MVVEIPGAIAQLCAAKLLGRSDNAAEPCCREDDEQIERPLSHM